MKKRRERNNDINESTNAKRKRKSEGNHGALDQLLPLDFQFMHCPL
jgi:hypothetical protein